jgi:hypothetical protein
VRNSTSYDLVRDCLSVTDSPPRLCHSIVS